MLESSSNPLKTRIVA